MGQKYLPAANSCLLRLAPSNYPITVILSLKSNLVTQISTTRPSLPSTLPVVRALFPPGLSVLKLCMSPEGEKPPSQSGDTAEDDQTLSTKSDPKSLEEAEKRLAGEHSFPDGGRDAWTVSNQVLGIGCNTKFLQVVAGAWLAIFISFGFLNAFGGTPLIPFTRFPSWLIFDPSAQLERSVRFYLRETSSIHLLTLFFLVSRHITSLISWPTNRKARSHGLGHFKHSGNSWIILMLSKAPQKLFLVCSLWVPSLGVYSISSELGYVLLTPFNRRFHYPEHYSH